MPVDRPQVQASASSHQVSEMLALFRETVALFHSLQATAAAIHGDLSASLRGVLFGLAQEGSQTVPQMAHQRPTSRQHVQVLVNRLLELGLVALDDNPEHRRSKLVRLTDEGEMAVARMRERETRLLERADVALDGAELQTAARTLREVRATLMEPRFRELLAKAERTAREVHDA